jgi:hypothetical protein
MPLFSRKQFATVFSLVLLIIIGTAAVRHPRGDFKNLKILPQDISQVKLDSIMGSYNKALGEGCKFCHTPLKDFPDSLDYASDVNPMKENAREMMRMTILINKTYFYHDKNKQPEFLNVVHCMTCHRGDAYPDHVD